MLVVCNIQRKIIQEAAVLESRNFSLGKAILDGLIMLVVATAFMFAVEVFFLHKSTADSLWLRRANAPINFIVGLLFSFLRVVLKMEQRKKLARFLLDNVALLVVQVPIYLVTLIMNHSTRTQLVLGTLIVAGSSLFGGLYGLLFDRVGKKKLTS